MLHNIKSFILTHEPFRQAHMGNWIRGMYVRHYLPRYVSSKTPLVLDAASGNGRHTILLRKLFPDAEIEGIDISAFPEWEKFTNAKTKFRVMDITTLAEENKYDLIVSIDTLEHIPGNEKVLNAFFKALKPGGSLYLHVPCEQDEIYWFPRSSFDRFQDWAKDEHIGEMRKLPELLAVMGKIGYEIRFARRTFTLFGHLAWELEFLLHNSGKWGRRFNAIFPPLYKLLGFLDLVVPIFGGGNLVIATKSYRDKSPALGVK